MRQEETWDNRPEVVSEPSEERTSHLEPVRVLLLGDEEMPTAALIEKRLRNVRRLYALAFVLRVPEVSGTELIPVAALLLGTDEDADLDTLVPIILQVRAAGSGSFWVDFFLQLPARLPAVADLHQWTEWLKNAHAALVEIAAICSILGTWLKTHAGTKAPSEAARPEDTDSPVTRIMRRIDELKGATDEEKEQMRRAIMRDLLAFEPMALDHSIQIPKDFPVKLHAQKSPGKTKR